MKDSCINPSGCVETEDISNQLFILKQSTVNKLFNCVDPASAFTLYSFYLQIAKLREKSNPIRSNDEAVKQELKWGSLRLRDTKKILSNLNLIQIIQHRENNKISGWHIKILTNPGV
jgi:hypothetical protein